jgi:hypothetical protein
MTPFLKQSVDRFLHTLQWISVLEVTVHTVLSALGFQPWGLHGGVLERRGQYHFYAYFICLISYVVKLKMFKETCILPSSVLCRLLCRSSQCLRRYTSRTFQIFKRSSSRQIAKRSCQSFIGRDRFSHVRIVFFMYGVTILNSCR